MPADWDSYKIHYRYRDTVHHITVTRVGAQGQVSRVTVDGAESPDARIALINDRREHFVEVQRLAKSERRSSLCCHQYSNKGKHKFGIVQTGADASTKLEISSTPIRCPFMSKHEQVPVVSSPPLVPMCSSDWVVSPSTWSCWT